MPRILACLGLALSAMEFGCSTTTGLRSVGTERPGWLGFWDRSQPPSPDPAADYYARYMHAAKERADALAKRSAESSGPIPVDVQSPSDPQDDERLASRERDATGSPSPRRSRRTTDPVRDERIHVTLGPPEPLPALAGTRDTALAWTASSPQGPGPEEQPPGEAEPAPAPGAPDRPWLAAMTPGDPERRDRHPHPSDRHPRPSGRPGLRPAMRAPSSPAARPSCGRSAPTRSRSSRVERVDGRLQPEEQVVLSIHRQPKEVRLQWSSGPSQGREVIYSTRVDDRSLFVHMPKSAIPLPTMKMAIDSPMVTRSSRHSITEAGFDTIIENLRKSVETGLDAANAAQGRAAYRGVEKPPGLDRPSHVFTRRSAQSGETWTVFIDASTMLPSMVVAKDPSGQLDEKLYLSRGASRTRPSWPRPMPSTRIGGGRTRRAFCRGSPGRRSDAESPNNRQSTTR